LLKSQGSFRSFFQVEESAAVQQLCQRFAELREQQQQEVFATLAGLVIEYGDERPVKIDHIC
jgi:hypothetical protein